MKVFLKALFAPGLGLCNRQKRQIFQARTSCLVCCAQCRTPLPRHWQGGHQLSTRCQMLGSRRPAAGCHPPHSDLAPSLLRSLRSLPRTRLALFNARRALGERPSSMPAARLAASSRHSRQGGAVSALLPSALPSDDTDLLGLAQQQGRKPVLLMSEPMSMLDVDQDLWQVLDLCNDEELELVYNILHSTSPFSPVVKSLVAESEPALIELRGRVSVMHKVESRFRFLAADPASLLQGKRPCYRETLLAIRDRVDVPCSANLGTYDLETEIFLHITQNCLEYVQGDEDLDPAEAAAIASIAEGDGMGGERPKGGRSNWVERVTAPIRFGLKELVPTVLKLGSAVTVTAAGQQVVQRLGAQMVSSHLRYQAAAKLATGMARGAVATWSKQAMLEGAQRGLTLATARYSALRGALSFLGPVMWGALALDLALKSIGTDYARVVRAVFILAQIRLVRTQGFVNTSPSGVELSASGSSGGSGKVDAVVPTASPSLGDDDDDVYGDPGGAW